MRIITDRIAQWVCGRYFMTYAGDELLLEATTDAEAITAGEKLMDELDRFEETQTD